MRDPFRYDSDRTADAVIGTLLELLVLAAFTAALAIGFWAVGA